MRSRFETKTLNAASFAGAKRKNRLSNDVVLRTARCERPSCAAVSSMVRSLWLGELSAGAVDKCSFSERSRTADAQSMSINVVLANKQRAQKSPFSTIVLGHGEGDRSKGNKSTRFATNLRLSLLF